MPIGTESYQKFIKQLRMVAINTNDIEKRNRMRDNMLRIVAHTFDASSVYICKHDFERKVSIVRHHFIGSRAKGSETVSDLFDEYSEDQMGGFVKWLYGNYSDPRIVYLDDLAEDDPERAEYEVYGIVTILMSALYFEGKLWGYIEFWDSRRKRDFKPHELTLIEEFSQAINDTILTKEG